MEPTSTYYERYWTPEGFLPSGPMNVELWDVLRDVVTDRDRCLDVGCGDGRTYGWWLNTRAAEYVGVDISTNAVQRARDMGLDARVIADAAELPFRDGDFDVAICIEVFEHLFAPHAAAAEIRRVLRPGGVLVASVPNVVYWRRRVDLVLGRWNPLGDDLSVEQPWRDPHIRFFKPATFASMLRDAGFSRMTMVSHGGAVLRDIPGLRAFRHGDRGSGLYRALERRFPTLLGHGIVGIAACIEEDVPATSASTKLRDDLDQTPTDHEGVRHRLHR